MNISDPKIIAELFNEYFIYICSNIDSKLNKVKHYSEYMSKVSVNQSTFFIINITCDDMCAFDLLI